MNHSFKVLFFLKRGNGRPENSMPIYVRVTIDGKRAEWSTQRSCSTAKWNQATGRAIGTKEETKTLNQYLDSIQQNIFQVQKEYALQNKPLTSLQVKSAILHQNNDRQHSLIEVFEYHNDQFGKLVGIEFSKGTYKRFRSALNSIREFLQWKYSTHDCGLDDVNHQFLTEYEFYLKSVKKLQHNSAMVNMKKLKKIVRLCVANDWMAKDPFRSYKITTKETHRNFLLKEELERLVDKTFSLKRLEQVRDIFVFSCYTGLSYVDIAELKSSDIAVGIDGGKWIFTKRTKTNTESRIPLLPVVQNLIHKYSSDPKVCQSNSVLPRLSNQRLNSYLKEIATLCDFNKELTFHCARHTFATTVTLTNGVPIETVGKMLGHKNIRTTQLYAKILDTKVSKDMQGLIQSLKHTTESR